MPAPVFVEASSGSSFPIASTETGCAGCQRVGGKRLNNVKNIQLLQHYCTVVRMYKA